MARAGIRSTRGYQSFPEMYRRAEVAVLSRELDPKVLGEVSPFDMSYMERRIGFLERQGWSVFSTFDGRVLESGSAPSE